MTEQKRRGRPRKNVAIPLEVKKTFTDILKEMDEIDSRVDWEKVAKKQETELKIIRNENEDLAKICIERWETIQDKDKIIKYLEGRLENLAIRSR